MNTVADCISKIRNVSDVYSLNETHIKHVAIHPILYSLGWDIFDLDEVYLEYQVDGDRVDYALLIDGERKVFIEAKRPSEDLKQHEEQLVKYSFKYVVEMAILTNGVEWWFYLPYFKIDWDKRKFLEMNILDEDRSFIEQSFIQFLSKRQIQDGAAARDAERILMAKINDGSGRAIAATPSMRQQAYYAEPEPAEAPKSGNEPTEIKQRVLYELSDAYGVRFQRIVKVTSDPPQYRIETDRGSLSGDVDLILNQRLFRRAMVEVSDVVVSELPKRQWNMRAGKMFSIVETETESKKLTDAGQVRAWLSQYLTEHRTISNDAADALPIGAPFINKPYIYIVGSDFSRWLMRVQGQRVAGKRLGIMLRRMGCRWEQRRMTKEDGSASTRSVWRLPKGWDR